ncbi:diguanylate cyclase domain-containing protein [Bacillus rubiinfantis]|uniref:diguanylate cyclase domain-containing protein n=1 Tax=Bacillus rubiinfantis TaxID=1499680 RepID=UPI0006933133|nr:diguanylate cyclase [Bacillus rubiinfantis]
MSDVQIIKERNLLLLRAMWLFLLVDIPINMFIGAGVSAIILSFAAIPAMVFVTYLVMKNKSPILIMNITFILFITVLIILNLMAPNYINLFFFILPPIISVLYRHWKHILLTSLACAMIFTIFLLVNGEQYYIDWETFDIFYFLLFFGLFAILNMYETRFSEGIRRQLMDELTRVTKLQSQLQVSEKLLQENEQQLRQMYEHMTDIMVKIDHHHHIQFISPACKQILGYEPEELILQPFSGNIHESDLKQLYSPLRSQSNSILTGQCVFRYRHRNGQFIWLEAAGNVLLDKMGEKTGAVFVCRDITERVEAESLIEKQERLLNGTAEAMYCLLTNENHVTAIEQSLEMIGNAVAVNRVYIFENQWDKDQQEWLMSKRYEWTSAEHLGEGDLAELQNISYGHAGFSRWYEVLSSGQILQGTVSTFPQAERIFLEKKEIQSLLVMPIFISGEFWGFIGFDDCEQERHWGKNEEAILLTAAAGIGGAIKLNRDANLLQESESKYRLIADNMSDFVSMLAPDGMILYASPSHESMMNIKVSEFEGTYPLSYFHPEDRARFVNQFQQMINHKGSLQADVRWNVGDDCFHLEMRGKPVVEENGEIHKIVMVARNITERVMMEEKVKQTSARLEALISHLPYGILAEDNEGKLILINERFIEMFHFPAIFKEYYGIKPYDSHLEGNDIFVEEERYKQRSEEIIAKRQIVSGEEWELKDGRVVSRDAIPIFVNQQFNGFLWQFKDITEQKKVEKHLKEASFLDGLTKIYNRRFFDEALGREWQRCARNASALTLIMFDIDYFKKYNDTYGHLEGDACLISVAKKVQDTVKCSSDVVCRYGGEEFVIILPAANQAIGTKLAEKIRDAIESLHIPHSLSTVSPYVTSSLGVATIIPTPASTPEELIRMADLALYTSKKLGRNRVSTYEANASIKV